MLFKKNIAKETLDKIAKYFGFNECRLIYGIEHANLAFNRDRPFCICNVFCGNPDKPDKIMHHHMTVPINRTKPCYDIWEEMLSQMFIAASKGHHVFIIPSISKKNDLMHDKKNDALVVVKPYETLEQLMIRIDLEGKMMD